MLNDVIRIDLHIHSKASSYKENGNIVRDSDENHIDVLLEKLSEHSIDLFSITDHNRFDSSLYKALDSRLKSEDSPCKATLLPGVEFDVELQIGKTPAHVIAIFDAKDIADYDKIEAAINSFGHLESKSAFYPLDDFEKVLRDIDLSAILIAHQHSGFNGNQRPRSLGKAADNAIDFYRYGFIDALEYNSSKIQGILRGELADLELPARMVIGTDCHEWKFYPKHDKKSADRDFEFASIRALPSFQGLLMALTSPSTRIGVKQPEKKPSYCESISLCAKTIPFSPGLNVIIGENGSGKSSILSLLCDNGRMKNHVAKVKEEYRFSCKRKPLEPIFVRQGDLQDRYHKGSVFDSALFENPDNAGFSSLVRSYAASVKEAIKRNIAREEQQKQAAGINFIPDEKQETKTFSFTVAYPDDFADDDNPWSKRADSLQGIETLLSQEIEMNIYSDDEREKLRAAKTRVKEVHLSAIEKRNDRTVRTSVKGVILQEFKKYDTETKFRASNEDRNRSDYRQSKSAFINAVLMLAKQESSPSPTIKSTKIPSGMGVSRKQHNGFTFVRNATYSGLQDFEEAFTSSFNKKYQTIDALLNINTDDQMSTAIPGQIKGSWEHSFDELVENLIGDLCKTEDTILGNGDESTGNTLGERALTYYKYMSLDVASAKVFVVDQPEDNISNQRINEDLIDYLNELRKRTQLIIVTHNPLLVVNLDADNVIALSVDRSGKRHVVSGCLESDDDGRVLQEVADLMDGGKEAIRRRMKAYGTID